MELAKAAFFIISTHPALLWAKLYPSPAVSLLLVFTAVDLSFFSFTSKSLPGQRSFTHNKQFPFLLLQRQWTSWRRWRRRTWCWTTPTSPPSSTCWAPWRPRAASPRSAGCRTRSLPLDWPSPPPISARLWSRLTWRGSAHIVTAQTHIYLIKFRNVGCSLWFYGSGESAKLPTSWCLFSDPFPHLPKPLARCVYVCVSQWVTHPSLWS